MSNEYVGLLPSGASISGTKEAVLEMQATVWRAEPTTECGGQSWRAYAEALEAERFRMWPSEEAMAHCQFCRGAKGGVKGNENVLPGGVVACDHCAALVNQIAEATR